MIYLKRASVTGALFFLGLPVFAASHCSLKQDPDWHTVDYVQDGDSLRLSDRRRIRLIGVNTPELARDNRSAEPYSFAARAFVKGIISDAHNRVGLVYDTDRKDRYGRTLAHIVLPDGSNLTRRILQEGLGSHVAIAPNLDLNNCYREAQQEAALHQRNLWQPASKTIINITGVRTIPGGFRHVEGEITRIGNGPKNIWLNFGQKLAIRIAREDLHYFTQWAPESLLKKKIRASGWIYTTKGHQRMRIYHPSVIHVLN